MSSIKDRNLAEKFSASVLNVRAVINNIVIPGINIDEEDQRFLLPVIGEKIYFRNGLYGLLKQVIINPNNRRVVDIIVQDQFPDRQHKTVGQLLVIPVNLIRYLTNNSGYLNIDNTETTQYQEFNSTNFVNPDTNWLAPYPYYNADVLFLNRQAVKV